MQFNEARKIVNDLKKFKAQLEPMVTVMGVEAKNHFTMSFRNQGFTDETLVKWQPRKRLSYRRKSGKVVDDTTRGILIGKGKGRLWRSISWKKRGLLTAVVFTNVPYAAVHNEGLRAGRGRGFIMKKRQFMGDSAKLTNNIFKQINKKIKLIWD